MGFSYRITEQRETAYFLTCTVKDWADVFTRPLYNDIIVDSLRYCQQHKELRIHGWTLMTNHLHLIAGTGPHFDLSDVLRDFKKFTSTRIVEAIRGNPQESRRSWLDWLFSDRDAKKIQFWQPGNHPEHCRSQRFFLQKLDYNHDNPVRAGFVRRAEDWLYGSAIDYAGGKGLLPITEWVPNLYS